MLILSADDPHRFVVSCHFPGEIGVARVGVVRGIATLIGPIINPDTNAIIDEKPEFFNEELGW